MKVRDLKLEPALSTRPDASIAEAADRMRYYEIGSLAVLDRGAMVAIVTERDVLSAVADRADPETTAVRSYMTKDPVTIDAGSSVEDAALLMLMLGIRHLPVVEAGRLVGMASIRDVLGADVAEAS